IMNTALTLENLQAEFYKQGLARFNDSAFTDAGFDVKVRNRLALISAEENAHVSYLTSAIQKQNGKPNPPCTYKFPLEDLTKFLATAQLLENAGTSAYLGTPANLLHLPSELQNAIAGVTTAEARQASYLNELWGQVGFPYPIDTALSLKQAITIVSTYIAECPYDIGIKPYPALTATVPENSYTVTTNYEGKDSQNSNSTYCQFLCGSKSAVSPRNNCTLPADAVGYTYVFVTSDDTPVNATSDNDNILAGPTLL
ncbi:ferritin-like domain-domain-containing protein, partial [Lobosporangium transversale]